MAFPMLDRRAAWACSSRPPSRCATSSTRQRAVCSCGSTCSGSSVTPRCTSSRCRSSASSPRSSRSSAASRSSATSAWSYATLAIAAPVGRRVGSPHVRHRRGLPRRSSPVMTFLIAVPTGVKFFNWIGTMWGGSVDASTPPMLWSIGFLIDLPLRWSDRRHPGEPAARLPRHRLLLRGRALPLRGLRHGRVRDVRRVLLLVAEADRPDARRAPRQDATSGLLFVGFHDDVPRPALARCVEGMPRRYADYLPGVTGSRVHEPVSRRSARSCSVPRCCRSSGTSTISRNGAAGHRRRPVGLGTTRWSGRTTLPAAAAQLRTRSRGSARSRPRSTSTTRRSRRSSTYDDEPAVALRQEGS